MMNGNSTIEYSTIVSKQSCNWDKSTNSDSPYEFRTALSSERRYQVRLSVLPGLSRERSADVNSNRFARYLE